MDEYYWDDIYIAADGDVGSKQAGGGYLSCESLLWMTGLAVAIFFLLLALSH